METKKELENVCCCVLEKINIGWMYLDDGSRCLPYISNFKGDMYRVNYCPSCGKYVRDIIILPKK